MSVAATGRIKLLPFRLPPNAAFPAGLWTGQVFGAGDASGGNITLTHEINLITEPFSAMMFTIEQVELSDDGNVARTYIMDCIGFEEHGPVGTRIPRIEFETTSGNPTSATALRPDRLLPKPFFLGRADRESGNDTTIRFVASNTDTIAYQTTMFGYFWGPAAMNALGGPQRPPGSLFGN